MAKDQKVYMPLMIGDWLKGTLGMKAEVRGVYINLLLYQWDNGFIPADMEELCLIDPELPKVWDKLKAKFTEVEPGKLQNKKNEDVREFWRKQRQNGGKGGRPKKDNPNKTQSTTQTQTQNETINNDLDLDSDIDLKNKKESRENVSRGTIDERLKTALDEIYIDQQRMKWSHINFDLELFGFIEKVRGSPEFYAQHDTAGLRLAFQSQLRHAKKKTDGHRNKNDRAEQNLNDIAIILNHAAGNSSGSG